MDDDLSEFRDIFLSELEENISLLNTTLLDVEKNPNNKGLIQELRRAAHTVKGMAATMGFDNLTRFSHTIEDYLQNLDNVSPSTIQALFKAADKFQEFYNAVEQDNDVEDIEIDDVLNELKSSGEEADIGIRQGTTYKLEIKFDDKARLLGARGFQVLRAIDSIAEIISSNPPINVLEEGKLLGDIEMEIISFESEYDIRNVISDIQDVVSVNITRLIDETAVEEVKPKPKKGKKEIRTIQSVRVNLDKLDTVVDLLGELVITKGRLQSLIPSVTQEISEQFQLFDSTINTIQDTVMGLRMVSLSRIFDTYPRAIRDIAHSRGIEIDLLLQGTHIQIDRSVVDQVNEALLHLLRNAAIHGIEDTNIRKSLGKPAKGTIRLAAHRERGEIVFEVEDDGSGLDIDAIRAKAIAKKLINPNEPLSRAQIAALIFKPGFSTATELTDVAGRGVGMNIVKNTIDEISGTIQIRTKKGKGTRFIIRVPQTLAIIEALIIMVNKQLYAIPILNVEKIFSAHDPSIIVKNDISYLNYLGHHVRIIKLREVFSEMPMMNSGAEEPQNITGKSREKVILWERAGSRICLQVDNVVEQREIVTKTLDEVYSGIIEGFSGATILGYDEVALIIDPDKLENYISNQENLIANK